MTPKTGKSYIWDALSAAETILSFTAGKTYEDYERDMLLRAGVERMFGIIGEAFVNVRRLDLALAART